MKTREITLDTAYGEIEVAITDTKHAHVMHSKKFYLHFRGAEYTASVHIWRNKDGEWSIVNPAGGTSEVYIYKRIGVNRNIAAPTHATAIAEEILQTVQIWSDHSPEVFDELQTEEEQKIFQHCCDNLAEARRNLEQAEAHYNILCTKFESRDWFNDGGGVTCLLKAMK